MTDEETPFDANAFEKAQKKERQESLKETLLTPLGTTELQPGQGETPIVPLDVISHNWRQQATTLLRALDPDAYAAYRKMKYEGGPDPDHATRMRAYRYAVGKFLEISYKLAGC
jgi:hypothetical protein